MASAARPQVAGGFASFPHFSVLAPDVLYASDRVGGVFLDIPNNRMHSVDSMGDYIVKCCADGLSVEEIKVALRRSYPDHRDQIATDVDDFLASLRARRLIVDAKDAFVSRSTLTYYLLRFVIRVTRVRGSTLLLPCLYLRLVMAGILVKIGALGLIHRLVEDIDTSSLQSSISTESIVQSLHGACVLFPTQVLCLQKSTVLVMTLREHSAPAQMVIGAVKRPFRSHAWVELNNRLIGEKSSLQDELVEIARF